MNALAITLDGEWIASTAIIKTDKNIIKLWLESDDLTIAELEKIVHFCNGGDAIHSFDENGEIYRAYSKENRQTLEEWSDIGYISAIKEAERQ